MTGTSVYVAAGSNVAPFVHLPRALDALHRHFAPLRVSTAYANAAVGFDGEDFVNLVVGFDTALSVHDVITRLHEAEAACGRLRDAPKWAARSMDLDILLFGDWVCDGPGLTLPRPDLLRRPYMLGPAAELAPDLVHPTARRTLRELWNDLREREPHALRPVALGWVPPGRGGESRS
jgi:2-amino-4-hydroxy-6-hydroxymethyldihydropteridine diphosphokinase